MSNGSAVVASVGALLLTVSLVVHLLEFQSVDGVVGPVLAFGLDGGLSALLLGAGLWLEQTELSGTDQWFVAVRTVFGSVSGVVLIGLTFVVRVVEGRVIAEPIFPLVVAASGGGLVLFLVGYNGARARELSRRYESVFDNTYQFTGILRPDGTITDVNETVLSLGRYDRSELVGKKLWHTPFFDRRPTSTHEVARDAVERARNGVPFREQVRVRGRDGETDIDLSVRPVRDDAGDVSFLIVEGRDITQIRQTKEHAEILHRYLRHNLRNELNIVHGYADLLTTRLEDSARLDEAEKVREVTEQMVSTVELVRQVSNRIQNDDAIVETIDVGLAVQEMSPHPDRVESVPSDLRICAPPEFVAVLDELVGAVSELSIDRDPEVRITRHGDDVEITIRCDTGIPATELSEFRSGTARSATHHPNRLSFWLMKAVVRESGGHVDYEYREDGTDIRVVLPTGESDDTKVESGHTPVP